MDSSKRVSNGEVGIAVKVANIPDMNIFGTTTSAKRATNASLMSAKSKPVMTSAKNLTAGQRLMRLKGKVHTIIEAREGKPPTEQQLSACKKVFDACIERRLKYEASVHELEELAKKEAQRLQTEETMNRKGDMMKEYLAEYSNRIAEDETKDKGDERISNDNKLRNKAESSRKIKKEQQMVAEGDGDDLLAELLGDDMPMATSSGFDNVSEVCDKIETKQTRGKKREKKEAPANSPSVPAAKRVKLESNREEPSSMPIITIVSGKQ